MVFWLVTHWFFKTNKYIQPKVHEFMLNSKYLKWRNFSADLVWHKRRFFKPFDTFGAQNFHFAPIAPNFLCAEISPPKVIETINTILLIHLFAVSRVYI